MLNASLITSVHVAGIKILTSKKAKITQIFCWLQVEDDQRGYGATRRSHLGTRSNFKDSMVTPTNTRTYTTSTHSSGPLSSSGGSQVRVAFRKNGAPNSSNMLSDDPPYEGEESDEEKL